MAQASYELALETIQYLQGKTLEIALANVTPVKALSGSMEWTEVGAGLGYSRQSITLANGIIELGLGYKTSNQTLITFGAATSDWGTINGWAIFENGGDMLLFDDFHVDSQVPIYTSQSYDIHAGNLVIHVT